QAQSAFVSSYSAQHQLSQDLRLVPVGGLYATADSPVIRINETQTIEVVLVATMLVLLSGCVTLMSLILIHYERRRHEFSVRLALGVDQRRLALQPLKELLPPVLTGWLLAVVLASFAGKALAQFRLPSGIDLSRLDMSPDWRVLLAAFALSTF